MWYSQGRMVIVWLFIAINSSVAQSRGVARAILRGGAAYLEDQIEGRNGEKKSEKTVEIKGLNDV